MTGPRYVHVAVDLAVAGADRLFTYRVPAEWPDVAPGTWVQVPFGHRQLVGCCIGPAPAPAGVEVRPLGQVIEDIPPLPPDLIDLARWVADRYLCPLAAALRLTIPAGARRLEVRQRVVPVLELAVSPEEAAAAAAGLERSRAGLRARVLRLVAQAGGPVPLAQVAAALGDHSRAAAQALVAAGLLRRREQAVRRDPFAGRPAEAAPPPPLTVHQEAALAAVEAALDQALAGQPVKPVLLHGVTGSGKTEVYLRAIAAALARGRQALVLVPEISLTPQTVARFRARFGDRVAVLHSALSEGERFDEWVRIRTGEAAIVVGARSAVFAPCTRLGIAILDEEHEGTYKQQDSPPAYHAREVAEERCRRAGALLVLGSATPAVETYWRAERGEVLRVRLPQRVDGRPLPPVTVVDMREELRALNRSLFSRTLQEALAQTLAAGDQAILFLNRRGYHTFVLCRACGEAVACPHCAVTLTYHLAGPPRLECHYCGHRQGVPDQCPACGSRQIKYLGAGTERVEAELRRLFPAARVLRLDVETARGRGAHAAILDAFGRGEADVLIGTQMVTKGLDFPRVTLVGVVLADTALHLPDFRSAERTFQLVTQVAGRAGRGGRPGRVVVQTYRPDHFAIRAATQHDYAAFYREEIAWRRSQGFPPYADYVRLVLSGPDEAAVAASAQAVRALLAAAPGGLPGEVLGPAPAPLARLRGLYRYHLLLRGPDRAALAAAVRRAFQAPGARWRQGKDVRLAVDVGPYSIL